MAEGPTYLADTMREEIGRKFDEVLEPSTRTVATRLGYTDRGVTEMLAPGAERVPHETIERCRQDPPDMEPA